MSDRTPIGVRSMLLLCDVLYGRRHDYAAARKAIAEETERMSKMPKAIGNFPESLSDPPAFWTKRHEYGER